MNMFKDFPKGIVTTSKQPTSLVKCLLKEVRPIEGKQVDLCIFSLCPCYGKVLLGADIYWRASRLVIETMAVYESLPNTFNLF